MLSTDNDDIECEIISTHLSHSLLIPRVQQARLEMMAQGMTTYAISP